MNIAPIPAFSDNYIWMLERDGRVAVVDPGDANPVLAVLTERGVTPIPSSSLITTSITLAV